MYHNYDVVTEEGRKALAEQEEAISQAKELLMTTLHAEENNDIPMAELYERLFACSRSHIQEAVWRLLGENLIVLTHDRNIKLASH